MDEQFYVSYNEQKTWLLTNAKTMAGARMIASKMFQRRVSSIHVGKRQADGKVKAVSSKKIEGFLNFPWE